MSDPIRIRASSFGELLDCAHRWEAKHLLGVRRPASGPQRLGTALHAATAHFDRQRVLGVPVTASEAVGVFMDTLDSKDEPVRWDEDLRRYDAEKVGALLTARYCNYWSASYDYLAVELELKDMVIECDSVSILLTGTMDRGRIIKSGPEIAIADLKSGARAVHADGKAETKGYSAQLGVYQLLAGYTLQRPVADEASIIGLRTNLKNPTIGVGTIRGAQAKLVGTATTPGLLDYAADTLKSGMFRPNPSSRLCSERYCPRWDVCRYHE